MSGRRSRRTGTDEGEGIEAGRVDVRRRGTREAPPPPRGIADAVEWHGIADEAILDEDTWAPRLVAGIEPEFDLAAHEFGTDFQVVATEAEHYDRVRPVGVPRRAVAGARVDEPPDTPEPSTTVRPDPTDEEA